MSEYGETERREGTYVPVFKIGYQLKVLGNPDHYTG